MDLQKGDIVLVPFPFTNLNSAKVRPVLVIHANKKLDDLLLMAITSQKSSKDEISLNNENLSEGKLPLDSYLRYLKITTLHGSLVRQRVGRVKIPYLKKIIQTFKNQI